MSDNLIYMYGKLSKTVEILVTNNHDVKNRVGSCTVIADGSIWWPTRELS